MKKNHHRPVHYLARLGLVFFLGHSQTPAWAWAQVSSPQASSSQASSTAIPSLWGVTLGQALRLEECPFRRVGPQKIYDSSALEAPCIKNGHAFPGLTQPLRRVVFPDDHPQVFNVLDRTIYVQEHRDQVVGIYYKTPGIKTQTYTLWELIHWAGHPSSLIYQDRESATGQKTSSVLAKWHRPWGEVVFEGARDNAQVGYVSIRMNLNLQNKPVIYAKP
jgi:hypothetical protein